MLTNRYTSKLYYPFTSLSKASIKKKQALVASDYKFYPKNHLAPRYGLLNDPNGLAYYNGYYYIFYQYHPNNIDHGLKHWALYKTKDFINYDDLGIFLAPHNIDDNYGIYSGGALVINDKLYLFYTANARDINNQYTRHPTQYYVIIDKEDNIIKRSKLIDENTLYTEHLRDPYPFMNNDDLYLIIGAQNKSLQGEILAYSINKDFSISNEYRKIKLNPLLNNAYMLECPNLIKLNNNYLLILSPQGLKSNDKYTFNNIYDVIYSTSNDCFDFSTSPLNCLDYGFDFYAPQVFNDGNETILIAWLGCAETIYPMDKEYGWSQLLSLPRILSIEDNTLYQKPHPSIDKLLYDKRLISNTNIITSRSFKLEIQLNNDSYIRIGNDLNYIDITYSNNELCLDRTMQDYPFNEEYGNKRYLLLDEDIIRINLYFDHSTLELFINDGQFTMSSRIYINKLNVIKQTNICGYYYDIEPFMIKR